MLHYRSSLSVCSRNQKESKGSESIDYGDKYNIIGASDNPQPVKKYTQSMARSPRFVLPGQPHHLIQRGNNRSPIFFQDQNYQFFLDCLHDASERYLCRIHAYVLMTNHVHLLVSPEREEGLGRLMQSVGRRYVQGINRSYQRTGTLWEGRYRAVLIDSEQYVLTCYCYIELNPVRAKIVRHPSEYRWSSYRHHAEGKTNPIIHDHALYDALGRDIPSRCRAYRALFAHEPDEESLNGLREATNKGWVLGREDFKSEVEGSLKRCVGPLPRGGRRPGAGRPKQESKLIK